MKKTADEDTRNEAELLHWFHRLATAQDAEEMEKLWEETGASGEARLEAFTRKTLAVSAGFTGTIGPLLARLEPSAGKDKVVHRLLDVLNRLCQDHSELARRLGSPEQEAVSRWPFLFRDPGRGLDLDWPQLVLVRRDPGTPGERLSSRALEIARNVARRCPQVLILPGRSEEWVVKELARQDSQPGDPGEPAYLFDEPAVSRDDRMERLRSRCLEQKTRFLLVDNLARLEPGMGEVLPAGGSGGLARGVLRVLHDTFRCFALVIAVFHPFSETEAEHLLSEGWFHHLEPAGLHGGRSVELRCL